jgi:hypothetical protein
MWRLVAPILAFLLLGASFLRAGNEWLVAICGLLILLLVLPRPWVARLAQLVLVLGTVRWLWLTWTLASVRAAAGVPFGRMVAILGAVMLLTLLAVLAFQSRRLQRYYRFDRSTSP